MAIPRPARDQIKKIVADLGLSMTDAEVDSHIGLMEAGLEAYDLVDRWPEEPPAIRHPRTRGSRPPPEENPHNAWAWKTVVNGSDAGPLAGKKVVLKDNILLADAPMMNGTSILERYVPEIDATVVTRILDAGGTIVGKAHCEGLCLSGGSHTNVTGPVHNPHRMGYSAGGSSSGCAVLVALGEVDMAVGCDQGGSIRMPSSFCGTYGMKPTYGLVPYTGIMPIEVFVDHAGPMTDCVADNALLLEVLAGADGFDPRQQGVTIRPYAEALGVGVRGLAIGVVREGFSRTGAEPDVEAKVRAGADVLRRLGADVREISIPWHVNASAVWVPIGVGGLTHTMMRGDAMGGGRADLYVTSLTDAFRAWRHRADELPATVKLHLLLGEFIRERYGTRYYGKAVNLARRAAAAYDSALAECDLLLMPTTPMKATPLPPPDAPREQYHLRATEPTANTMPFNVTHHPAMSVPCGMSEGLPVGMMLVGRHWDEPTIYRAAHAFEQAENWRTL